ncbi:hypothetical protein [Amorphus sp. 3PC139-8]|uniref:hypothetical protein n=1 Tax=Amorphus sp. 3PC139-8 TaxID=2735676 RepID=UPI00345D324B
MMHHRTLSNPVFRTPIFDGSGLREILARQTSKFRNPSLCDAGHSREAASIPSSVHRGNGALGDGTKGPAKMTKHRITTRFLAASGAMLFTAIAVSAGVTSGGFQSTAKEDRFQSVSQELCAGQSWPNISPACVSWKSGTPATRKVRFVTEVSNDRANATTTLNRVPAAQQVASAQ